MQQRIQQLESLVVDLMQQTSASHPAQEAEANLGPPSPMLTTDYPTAATSDIDPVDNASPASDCGSMQWTKSGSSYVNSAHWAAVLDGIADIKDHFEKEEEAQARRLSDAQFPDWSGPQLLYGCNSLATKDEILQSIPARPVVDRLVSRYFNSFEMSTGKFTVQLTFGRNSQLRHSRVAYRAVLERGIIRLTAQKLAQS